MRTYLHLGGRVLRGVREGGVQFLTFGTIWRGITV